MWYELHTGTTECVDDVETGPTDIDDEDDPEFSGIGAVEAEETERKTRLNVSMSAQRGRALTDSPRYGSHCI